MNATLLAVEGLSGEVSTLRLQVLQHAAEISPFVMERTLGPDKDEHQIIAHKKTKSLSVDETENSVTVAISSPKRKSSSGRNSLEVLNYETINTAVILREAEQNRKSIRKQIEDTCKHTAKEDRINEVQDKLKKKRDKKWKDHITNENKIILEAGRQAEIQLGKDEREIAVLRGENQYALQMIAVQAIVQYQKRFRIHYEKVAKLLMSVDKQVLTSAESYNQKLKSFVKAFDQLIETIRNQDTGTTELITAENLCNSIEELGESILEAKQQQGQLQLKQRQQIQEKERQLELQKLQLAQTLQHQQQEDMGKTKAVAPANQISSQEQKDVIVSTNPTSKTIVEDFIPIEASAQFVSKERFIFYMDINNFYTEKVERVKPLQSDESMKKYRFACQKAINIPVNAISAVSQQHLQDKFEKLYSFILGNPLKTPDGQIAVNDHPLGRDYSILLMAKKFVSQGDTAVSSNPQAAFPLASVIVSLWKLVPEFGKLFLAYIFKESPFLVPYFIPQKRGQSLEEYSKTLGYRVTDGKIENQDMYLKRQSGIARLYSAVMITAGRRSDGPEHPYGIENGWIWLSNFITLHPLPDICSTLMLEFLHNAGADMLTNFGKQFRKLLLVIQQQYFPILSAVDEGGPKARLEILLGKILKEGQMPKPQGTLPSNFW